MKEYANFSKINKPIRFAGLTTVQFLGVFLTVAITFIIITSTGISFVVGLFVFLVEVVPVVFYATKASKEHKKGNSRYFDSLSNFMSTPKRLVDSDTFSFLKNNA